MKEKGADQSLPVIVSVEKIGTEKHVELYLHTKAIVCIFEHPHKCVVVDGARALSCQITEHPDHVVNVKISLFHPHSSPFFVLTLFYHHFIRISIIIFRKIKNIFHPHQQCRFLLTKHRFDLIMNAENIRPRGKSR